jgi:RHS repeat-associated protein
VKTFELKGVGRKGNFYQPEDFDDILSDNLSGTVHYHEHDKPPEPGKAQKRLIEHIRSTFYRNDLTGALPLNQLESLALLFENYQLAYSPELVTDIFENKADAAIMGEGRFTSHQGDNNWWVPSGITRYIDAAENQVQAQNRFYSPVAYTDPHGAKTLVSYYGPYFMFIEETSDGLGNKTKVEKFNFRTLLPRRFKDINGNLQETISDELGLVKAHAIMGKGNEADELTGLREETDDAEAAEILSFFNSPDSLQLITTGKSLLKRATKRFVYDFNAFIDSGSPAVVSSISREQYFQQNAGSPIQTGFEYSNGLGEVVMTKMPAEPGKARQVVVNPDNTVTIIETDTGAANPKQLRFTGSGRVIKNNKDKPVKQYEPFFSVTHKFEDVRELLEIGVFTVMYYDAPGRLVKTQMPDGTFSRVEFDAWKQSISDANDTILESSWFNERTNNLIDARLLAVGKDPAREKSAADKAALHADTPYVLHYNTLGEPVLSIEHNKNITTGADEFYRTIIKTDTEGNLRSITDARDNRVMDYKYDMLGNLVFQNSMDAGQRWFFLNISGNPLRTWDERDHEFRYSYDILQRPVNSRVLTGIGAGATDHIFERLIYGESLLLPDRSNEAAIQVKNVLGQVIQHYDTGGLIDTPLYDFKGQPLSVTRKLSAKYKETAHWTDAALINDLEPGPGFIVSTETDALGRIIRQTHPDGSIIIRSYNEAGLPDRESVIHPGSAVASVYIGNIDYNEKGQREKITYGNNVTTRFYYDGETFRLIRLESRRQNGDPLQDWHYTHDPVGNITHIEDKNIPVVFFNNQKSTGVSTFTYDALYRLVEATGRENNAALAFGDCDNWNDKPFIHQMNPGSPMSVRNYTQSYRYDEAGNITQMKHLAPGGSWTRGYGYENGTNRLKSTNIGDNGNPANYTKYRHHAKHGFMEELPHLEKIEWNFKDEVASTTRQHCTGDNIPVVTWYQYDGGGQRIRKITENQAPPGGMPTKREERIYLGGYELFIKHNNGLERESLSLTDEGHRFVMIETRNDVNDGTEKQLVRYQLHNHLGSAALELDGTNDARVISYEEYHPFGTTAYLAVNSDIKSAAKRYRYTGMERDEETGMAYHGARYYLPWLGRWLSSDPAGIVDGTNLYIYSENNPQQKIDPGGTQALDYDDPGDYEDFETFFQNLSGPYSEEAAREMWESHRKSQDDSPVVEEYEEYQETVTEYVTETYTVKEDTGVRGAATLAFAGMATDVMTPEPTDAVPWKWVGYAGVAIVGGIVLAVTSSKTVTKTRTVPRTVTRTRRRKMPLTYITYTLHNPATGEIYSGRSSGYGTPQQILAARYSSHHMRLKGFVDPQLDRTAITTIPYARRHTDPNYQAIRGREQMVIDAFGGSWSAVGRGNTRSGNPTRGIGLTNIRRGQYLTMAAVRFGRVNTSEIRLRHGAVFTP